MTWGGSGGRRWESQGTVKTQFSLHVWGRECVHVQQIVHVVVYLQVSGVRHMRDTLQTLGVAAPRAALHLDARRPQHEVGIAAIQHGPGDLHNLCTHFTQSLLGRLGV